MLRRGDGSPRRRNDKSLLTHDDDDFVLSIRPKNTCSKKTPIDRISMLHDSLLTHILSFLPIEDAIKTDVLSKRWQYLLTTLPSLLFRLPYPDSVDRIREFVTFVDKTLVLCNSSKIKKFVVDFKYDSRFSSNVNLWTRFATSNAAKELHLKFHTADNYLREDLNDGVIGKILSGSPVLENLELYYFDGITRLHVVNASLKKLILREFWEEEVDMDEEEDEHYSVLEILAPNLPSLEILGCFGSPNCWLADVSSLVDATLSCDFTIDDDDLDDDFEWHQNISRQLL
ncbi:hypothetical protein ACSBR1_006189 [Camellia fascicularis]